MHAVLCYDIAEGPRRPRFFRKLRGILVPVQESVFEGQCGEGTMAKLDRLIARELDPEVDAVRIYPLCEACAAKRRVWGVTRAVEGRDGVWTF